MGMLDEKKIDFSTLLDLSVAEVRELLNHLVTVVTCTAKIPSPRVVLISVIRILDKMFLS